MSGPEPHNPKVFISYSHDSLEHSDRVRELSDRLRADGVDCTLDQYEISPSEGWPRWTDNQISDAEFVLMICTETYYRRVMGKENPGTGLGVRWEGNSIYQHIYNAQTLNAKFIPVLLDSGKVEDIPTPLQGVARYGAETDEGYEDLYRRLTDQPLHLKPELGNVRKLHPLEPRRRKQDFFASSLTHLPFERNPFFTGREQILHDLHESFIKQGGTQVISGLGGLGKTQTAIEYAYRRRDDYKAVFWSRADSQLALRTGFAEIARTLNLPEKESQNPDDAVRAVVRWLESKSGWLLIFDNADAPEMVKEFRPRNPEGRVLLTSRAQVFDTLGIVKPFEIDVMLPEEALGFLFTRAGREDGNAAEREAAARLAEELAYLPLALEQAGAFITAKKARFQDYLAGYLKRRGQLLNESRPVTGDYPESVATTWAMNFRELEESPAASDLLRTSAFLSPDRIPLELIIKGKSDLGPALSAALADVGSNPLVLNEVLERLTRYSFIRLDSDLQTYSIHRLVQEVLTDGMEAETQKLWAERTVSALNRTFPEEVEFSTWPRCERLLPHTKVAAKLIEKWDITFEEAARLLNQAAYFCYEQGQYADAEPLYRRSLVIRERCLGAGNLDVAQSLNNLALLYSTQGRYTEAEPLFKQSLAIRERVLGAGHPYVAMSLNNLGELYRLQGRYGEAETRLKRSLVIKEGEQNPNPVSLAWTLDHLSLLHVAQGKYDEAEALEQRSLAIREKVFGSGAPDVAQSLNNLAELYLLQGKHTEAELLCKRSLMIREKALGPDHDDVAQSLNTLAELYRDQKRFIEAEPLYKRSLGIYEKVLGPDHPTVAAVLKNYAALLRALRRDAEAEKMVARAEAIRVKDAQQDSPKYSPMKEPAR